MTVEYNTLLEAKKSIKSQIRFFDGLLEHLKGNNKVMRSRAVWATWCLHRYIEDKLIYDMEDAIKNNSRKEDENVQ